MASEKLPEKQTFGRYTLIRFLGRGRMGRVYLAHDPQLDRDVALKIPEQKSGPGVDWRENFYKEAHAMAKIRHTNLCPVYEVDQVDGVDYLAMGFIEGPSLQQMINQHRQFDPHQVALLVGKLALATEQMHQVVVIHRDLKPSNIIIDDTSHEPVVVDFGLACTGATDELIVGTPGFIAPEIIKSNGQDVGSASDIYALGTIGYLMLTGRMPYPGSQQEIYQRQLAGPPPPPSQFCSGLDRDYDNAFGRALAPDPAQRFATARELGVAMERLVRKEGSAKKEPYKTFDLQVLSGCHIVHLHDESVLTMESLEETKRELFDMVETSRPLHLIVNFASVQRCSSAAVNVLLHLYVDIKATQTQMHLCGVRDSIRDVFRVLALEERVFKIYDSVPAALRAVEMA